MYLGRIVEVGPTEEVLADPQHPYTRALLSVVPEIDHIEPMVLTGEPPDPTRIPAGCRFHPRCPAAGLGRGRGRGRRRRAAAARTLPVLRSARVTRAPAWLSPADFGHTWLTDASVSRGQTRPRVEEERCMAPEVRRDRRRRRAQRPGRRGLPGQRGPADAGPASGRQIVGGAAVTEQPFGPDYTVTSLSYVVSLLPPALVRDLDLDRHGYHVYPQGPYFAPHADGRYLQLPDDQAARREQIAKFSDKDADAIEALGRLAGRPGARCSARCCPRSRPRSARAGPADLARPGGAARRAAQASTRARRSTSPGCSP